MNPSTFTRCVVGALSVLGILVLATACQPAETADGTTSGQAGLEIAGGSKGVTRWIDPETRCEYLIYSHSASAEGGMTVRLKANGDPMCPAVTGSGAPPASTLPGF